MAKKKKKTAAKTPAKKTVAKTPAKKTAAKTPAKKTVAKTPAKKPVNSSELAVKKSKSVNKDALKTLKEANKKFTEGKASKFFPPFIVTNLKQK